MRKITQETVNAFMSRKPCRIANTETDGNALYLHGNKIAYWTQGGYIIIQTCGWNSTTTRERLNGIPNVRLNTKKGQLFLNGKEWDGNAIAVNA